VRERLRRIPPGLGAVLVVSALLAITWACVTPAFQAPDEQRHYTYTQTLAERFALPGDPDRPGFSTQVTEGMAAMNADQVAGQRTVKPEWSPAAERAWAATHSQAPRDDGGGPSPASTYPPVSYAWEALGYLAASSGSVFDQLLGARLMSAFWLPFTVLGTWLLAGELFGRRRLLQTVAASVPALAPMVVFISGSVSPDGMLYAVWSFALWLGVRAVRRGVPVRDGVGFFALVGLACVVKATSFALLPAALLVAGFGLYSRRSYGLGRVVRLGAIIAVPLALTLGIWVLGAKLFDRLAAAQISDTTASITGTNWREMLSYVWQYYLPRIPGQTDYPIRPIGGGYPLLQVWITQGWGAFGWLEVKWAAGVYRVLGVITVGVGAAAAAALWRSRRAIDWRVASFLALACLSLLAGLHWTDYHQLEAGSRGFMQARYLFPVIAVFGAALAGAVSVVPARVRPAVAGGTVAGLFVFHLFAFGLVLSRFYA
jgi:4-amino-4-deoxy-L-arabinose transferase-like glycosyltransferase